MNHPACDSRIVCSNRLRINRFSLRVGSSFSAALSLTVASSWRADCMAKRADGADAERLRDEAEGLWQRLLEDQSLRTAAPAVYWEARYHWLSHQLRHNKAAEVLKGIRSEKAWYPDLGGPPWQGRLLELEAKAARMAE